MRGVELSGFSDLQPLGSGGIGDVYRAIRTSTNSAVAVKVLRDWSDQDAAWKRAQRELRALVDLRGHANVVNVEEVIETDGQLAIVMEYAPGGSVADFQQGCGGTLGLPEVLLVATDTAAALAASHRLGIIHRDIKPHNLLIGAFGNVKVCDFGIAALTRTEEMANRTNALSLRYASPEEVRGDADVGPSADIYSLAATIHQLLTGTYLPLPDGTARSVPLRTWTSPHDLPAEIDIEIRDVVTRCADRDPEQRPSAPELHDRLDALARQLGSSRCRALPVDGRFDRADDVGAERAERAAMTALAAAEPAAAPTAALAAAVGPAVDRTTAMQAARGPVAAGPMAGEGGEPMNEAPERRRRAGLPLAVFGVVTVLVIAAIALLNRGDGSSEVAEPDASVAPTSTAAAVPPPATAPSTQPANESTIPTTTQPAGIVPADLTVAVTQSTFEIAAADRFEGRSFEGIDGLAFDPTTELMVGVKEVAPQVVSAEDSARTLPALFSFPVDEPGALAPMGTLTDAAGNPFGSELDIEGATALADGTFVVVSEGAGELGSEGAPFILWTDSGGQFRSAFALPEWLIPSEDGTSGFQASRGPHGVAVRPGAASEVVVVMESPLRQDDPEVIRLTSFDVATGVPTREWSYPIDNGSVTVAMTDVADRAIIVLEQSTDTRERRLFLVELDDGDEPGGNAPGPLPKRLIPFADGTLGSLAWASVSGGPLTTDGKPTIVLMTNSNFNEATTVGVSLILE